MSSLKLIRLEQKIAFQQKEVISELEGLVENIDRCEKTISELKQELEDVNSRFKTERTTQQDVDYLTELLKCAKKKLNWEKHMSVLQKKVPEILTRVSALSDHPEVQPTPETRAQMMKSLQSVESAMKRLQNVKG